MPHFHRKHTWAFHWTQEVYLFSSRSRFRNWHKPWECKQLAGVSIWVHYMLWEFAKLHIWLFVELYFKRCHDKYWPGSKEPWNQFLFALALDFFPWNSSPCCCTENGSWHWEEFWKLSNFTWDFMRLASRKHFVCCSQPSNLLPRRAAIRDNSFVQFGVGEVELRIRKTTYTRPIVMGGGRLLYS